MLRIEPEMMLGMKRREVCSAESSCTSWQNKLKKNSRTFNTAHESINMMQIEVKAEFRQSELGIRAGLCSLSWRPTQNMKAGTSRSEIMRRVMLETSWMLDRFAVIELRLIVNKPLSSCSEAELTRAHRTTRRGSCKPRVHPSNQCLSATLSM